MRLSVDNMRGAFQLQKQPIAFQILNPKIFNKADSEDVKSIHYPLENLVLKCIYKKYLIDSKGKSRFTFPSKN